MVTSEIVALSLHDALPICPDRGAVRSPAGREGGRRVREMDAARPGRRRAAAGTIPLSLHRSEEHTSELQSLTNLVCRLLLEKKKHHVDPARSDKPVLSHQL